MSWNRSTPTNPKYRSPEHKAERKRLAREMQVRGYLWCAQDICIKRDRVIRTGERWCVGHNASGTQYIGPVHEACNLSDAGRRARAGEREPKGWIF